MIRALARFAGAILRPKRSSKRRSRAAHCKLQWKPDWAMRWYALGVDYEMAGKDLIDSVKLSSRIARVLGAEPPAGFNYELFLDENGQKISKSKGNGLTIEQWLAYASTGESLVVHVPEADRGQAALFRRHPAHGRRLPRLSRNLSAPGVEGAPGQSCMAHSFGSAARARDPRPMEKKGKRRFLSPCCSISPRSPTPTIRRFSGGSCAATRLRRRRKPTPVSTASSVMRSPISAILSRPRSVIARPTKSSVAYCMRSRPNSPQLPESATADEIQHALYDVARPIPRYQDHSAKGATPARPGVSNDFFNMIYAVLLGEERGPRLGSFIALYGLDETRKLIDKALAGDFVRESQNALLSR